MEHENPAPGSADSEASSAVAAAADGNSPGQPIGSFRSRDSRRIFHVRFGRSTGRGAHLAVDSLRLAGAGRIEIQDGEITLSGKRRRPFWFSAREYHNLTPSAVINVARTGRMIRFDISAPSGRDRFAFFRAGSDAEADAIVALLPTRQTPAFAESRAASLDFHNRLDKFSPHAPVTPVLVAINAAVFVAMCASGLGFFKPSGASVIPWGTNFGPLTLDGQWWRLFTSMFVHFGIIHIAMNMWVLLLAGRMIERMFGSGRFALLYLFAGLCASMTSLLWNPLVNSAGASGAIFGLFGGFLAFVINPRNGVPASVMKEHRNSTLAFVAMNLAYGFAHTGIDNAAHVGGLLSGFAIGFLLARPLDEASRGGSHPGRLLSTAAAGVAMLGLLSVPLIRPAGDVQARLRFQRVLLHLQAQEQAAVAAGMTLKGKIATGISIGEFRSELAGDVIPKWETPYRELAAVKLPASDSNYALQQLLLRYFRDRYHQFESLDLSLAMNDRQMRQQVASDQADAERTMAALKKLRPAR